MSSAHLASDTGLTELCLAVKPDVDRFLEKWRLHGSNLARNLSSLELLSTISRLEAVWDNLSARGTDDETDQLIEASVADLEQRIAALQAEVQVARDVQRRGRAVLLKELSTRRRRAAGVEKACSTLMRPAQVASAVADQNAKVQQQAAAHGAVRQQPWLAKDVLEGGEVEEGEVRLTLDHRRLLELNKFDSSVPCCTAAESATAIVWARFEAQSVAWTQTFEEEKRLLEAKICQVRELDDVDQKKHEALVATLMAKFEAHQESQRKEAAVGRGSIKQKEVPCGLRASLLGGAAAAAISAGPHDGTLAAHGGTPSSSRPVSRAGKASRTEHSKKIDLHREIYGDPLSESAPVRQWGSMLVSQLGLNFSPTKPRGYDSSTVRCKRMAKVPPRVAMSLEEAFSIEPESDGSMYLSRCLLGADRIPQGSCDMQLQSPLASATASTVLPSNASTRLR